MSELARPEGPARVRVAPLMDAAAGRGGFEPGHPYIELCYLPVIGPTSFVLLRRLGTQLARRPDGYEVDLASLARDVGLGESTGKSAPLRRSLDRLARFGLARWSDDGTYELATKLPALSPQQLSRLGPLPWEAHRHFTAQLAEKENPLLAAALSYAARGWPVFPLEPAGKVPDGRLAPHGLRDATCDTQRIRGWWRASPAANVGLRTGDRIDVVDIDSDPAREALLERVADATAGALVVRTGRGWHLWFSSSGLASRAGIIEGVDTRGRGGYVVAPPSVHPSGARYAFVDDAGAVLDRPPDTALARVPPALAELCTRRDEPVRELGPIPIRTSIDVYARRALERECADLASAAEGGRNHRLNRAAFAMGTLVGARALRARDAADALLEAARSSGLPEAEATRTIASGLNAGMARPRAMGEPETRGAFQKAEDRPDPLGAVLSARRRAPRRDEGSSRPQADRGRTR